MGGGGGSHLYHHRVNTPPRYVVANARRSNCSLGATLPAQAHRVPGNSPLSQARTSPGGPGPLPSSLSLNFLHSMECDLLRQSRGTGPRASAELLVRLRGVIQSWGAVKPMWLDGQLPGSATERPLGCGGRERTGEVRGSLPSGPVLGDSTAQV